MATEKEPIVTEIAWEDQDGLSYLIRRTGPGKVSVISGGHVVGAVDLPDSIPSLADATGSDLMAIVQRAIEVRELRRWEGEGGNPPAGD
jgi:hypothetical protein